MPAQTAPAIRGTTSGVQHEFVPSDKQGRSDERYTFMVTSRKAGQDDTQCSVVMVAHRIKGGVFENRDVDVYGALREDHWLHASRIVDVETQAVTEPYASEWGALLIIVLILAIAAVALAIQLLVAR